jgi:hypothetical protein
MPPAMGEETSRSGTLYQINLIGPLMSAVAEALLSKALKMKGHSISDIHIPVS